MSIRAKFLVASTRVGNFPLSAGKNGGRLLWAVISHHWHGLSVKGVLSRWLLFIHVQASRGSEIPRDARGEGGRLLYLSWLYRRRRLLMMTFKCSSARSALRGAAATTGARRIKPRSQQAKGFMAFPCFRIESSPEKWKSSFFTNVVVPGSRGDSIIPRAFPCHRVTLQMLHIADSYHWLMITTKCTSLFFIIPHHSSLSLPLPSLSTQTWIVLPTVLRNPWIFMRISISYKTNLLRTYTNTLGGIFRIET